MKGCSAYAMLQMGLIDSYPSLACQISFAPLAHEHCGNRLSPPTLQSPHSVWADHLAKGTDHRDGWHRSLSKISDPC